MRKPIPMLLATVLCSAAYADDKHHTDAAAKPAPASAAAPVASDKRFAAAYGQMKKMMAQMDKIRATKDPKERQRLMQEHMDAMHEGDMMKKDGHEADDDGADGGVRGPEACAQAGVGTP